MTLSWRVKTQRMTLSWRAEKTLRGRPVDRHKANLFLPRLYENLTGVGEIGECDAVLRLFGENADGLRAARQRARRVGGSAQGA